MNYLGEISSLIQFSQDSIVKIMLWATYVFAVKMGSNYSSKKTSEVSNFSLPPVVRSCRKTLK